MRRGRTPIFSFPLKTIMVPFKMLSSKNAFALVVTFACAAAFAECPPQHAELRRAINLGEYDQAREYIKQGVKDIYCGDMPADSAKVIWAKQWKQNPELALLGCLLQYTHFYAEKACEIRGVSPNICPGRLKDSTTLADPERFAALAKAALSNPEHKTRLRGEIATLGEERLIALADEAGFDFVRDSVLPEKMAAWAGMLRDLQRKFKLFGDGEKDYYPGGEKWMKSERARERITSYKKRKAAADAGQSEKLLQKAPTRGDTESQTVHLLKIVEVVDYTPTGRRVVVYSDGAPTTPQFTGKEMDAETGLYHFGARQYDPELGLWAQIDPDRQFDSPYAYTGNGVNPINGMDPDGNDWYDMGGEQLEWYEGSDPVLKPGFGNMIASIFGGGEYATSLGENVLWGRGFSENEPVNGATFDLYLAGNLGGPVASLRGNTIPSSNGAYATIAPGLYNAMQTEYNKWPALRLFSRWDPKGEIPTVRPNPSRKDGRSVATGILFHIGNTHRQSLETLDNEAISRGCQTGSHGNPAAYRSFMGHIPNGIDLNYYLTRQ